MESLWKQKKMDTLSKMIHPIVVSQNKIMKIFESFKWKYFFFPSLELVLITVYLVQQDASLKSKFIRYYEGLIVFMRMTQLMFAVDFIKVRLLALKQDVMEVVVQQHSKLHVNIDTIASLKKFKATYEEIHQTAALMNNTVKYSSLIYSIACALYFTNSIYYMLLNFTKEIPMITGFGKTIYLYLTAGKSIICR